MEVRLFSLIVVIFVSLNSVLAMEDSLGAVNNLKRASIGTECNETQDNDLKVHKRIKTEGSDQAPQFSSILTYNPNSITARRFS